MPLLVAAEIYSNKPLHSIGWPCNIPDSESPTSGLHVTLLSLGVCLPLQGKLFYIFCYWGLTVLSLGCDVGYSAVSWGMFWFNVLLPSTASKTKWNRLCLVMAWVFLQPWRWRQYILFEMQINFYQVMWYCSTIQSHCCDSLQSDLMEEVFMFAM